MRNGAIVILQLLLAFVFLATLSVQIGLLPYYAHASALAYPILAWIEVPCLVVAILVVACAQVVLVAVSALLVLTARDRIFRPRAFLFVDIIIGTILVAAALCLGLGLWLQLAAGFDSPADVELYVAAALGLGLALLVGVLRGLLKRATQLDADLAEVV